MIPTLRVLRPGPQTLVQDLGRPGLADLGVSPSGAFDAAAHRLAQRLVGNPEHAAGLEILLGDLELIALRPVTVAITGATAPLYSHATGIGAGVATTLPAGSQLSIGQATAGARIYLAVHGGLAAPRTLGSSARDVLSGLGPAPLRAGDVVHAHATAGHVPGIGQTALPRHPQLSTLRVVLGPRQDWFTTQSLAEMVRADYQVAASSNRIGIRLVGPPLHRRDDRELPPEPMVRGAIQVPPDGQPVILGADHPTTGGYPVAATVLAADVDRCAQLRPGDSVQFRLANPE